MKIDSTNISKLSPAIPQEQQNFRTRSAGKTPESQRSSAQLANALKAAKKDVQAGKDAGTSKGDRVRSANQGREHLAKMPLTKDNVFFQNDWDGSRGVDPDNQHVAQVWNTDPKIRKQATVLTAEPGKFHLAPNGALGNPKVVADATKKGPVILAVGGVGSEVAKWLDGIELKGGNLKNVTLISHSDWNQRDGGKGWRPKFWKDSENRVGKVIYVPNQNDHAYGAGKGGNNKDISDLGMLHYVFTRGNEQTPTKRMWG